MPHDTHPFAVMFRDGDSCTTFFAFASCTLLEWLKGYSPQLQVLDAVVEGQECRVSSIGELLACLRPEEYHELASGQMTFL